MAAEEILFRMVSCKLIPGEMSSNNRVYVNEWKNISAEHL